MLSGNFFHHFWGAVTFSIMTLSILTPSIMTLQTIKPSKWTLSITTLSITECYKTFSWFIDIPIKLECFLTGRPFKIILMTASKARAHPSKTSIRFYTLRYSLGLTQKQHARLERPVRDKHSSLLQNFFKWKLLWVYWVLYTIVGITLNIMTLSWMHEKYNHSVYRYSAQQ
jgi:hypothetical protein